MNEERRSELRRFKKQAAQGIWVNLLFVLGIGLTIWIVDSFGVQIWLWLKVILLIVPALSFFADLYTYFSCKKNWVVREISSSNQ